MGKPRDFYSSVNSEDRLLRNRSSRRESGMRRDMPKSRVICSCGAVLKKDEREHYLYLCTSCVVAEHDLIRRHQRGEDHPDIDALFSGPVLIDGLEEPAPRKRAA